MNSGLQWLIAGACIVVIAGGAHYGWSAYDRSVQQADVERELDRVRANLFEWADAQPHEAAKVVTYCNDISRGLDPGDEAELTRKLIRDCRSLGFL